MSLKPKDLRIESVDELQRKLEELRQGYMELRFQHASGTLKNPVQLREIRKDIAKVITIISEKEAEK